MLRGDTFGHTLPLSRLRNLLGIGFLALRLRDLFDLLLSALRMMVLNSALSFPRMMVLNSALPVRRMILLFRSSLSVLRMVVVVRSSFSMLRMMVVLLLIRYQFT